MLRVIDRVLSLLLDIEFLRMRLWVSSDMVSNLVGVLLLFLNSLVEHLDLVA